MNRLDELLRAWADTDPQFRTADMWRELSDEVERYTGAPAGMLERSGDPAGYRCALALVSAKGNSGETLRAAIRRAAGRHFCSPLRVRVDWGWLNPTSYRPQIVWDNVATGERVSSQRGSKDPGKRYTRYEEPGHVAVGHLTVLRMYYGKNRQSSERSI